MVDKKEKADSKKTASKPKKSELPPEGSAAERRRRCVCAMYIRPEIQGVRVPRLPLWERKPFLPEEGIGPHDIKNVPRCERNQRSDSAHHSPLWFSKVRMPHLPARAGKVIQGRRTKDEGSGEGREKRGERKREGGRVGRPFFF